MNIEHFNGGYSVVKDKEAGVVFLYEREGPRDFNKSSLQDKFNWDDLAYSIGDGYYILPYGDSNNLPTEIKNVLFENHMAPGLMNKKTQLLWGQSPQLYAGEKFVTNTYGKIELIRNWVNDTEVMDWLESWDFRSYLLAQCVDFNYMESCFSKLVRSRAYRIGGQGFISKLEHIPIDRAQLASNTYEQNKQPTHAVISNYAFTYGNSLSDYRLYDLFDMNKPFRSANSVVYSNLYSFCMDNYSMPAIYGALEWIRRSTSVPWVIKALSDNSLNVKYHITSPQAFWEDKEKRLKEDCERNNIEYKSEMLADYETQLFRKITKVLGGPENVGKIWHTKDILEIIGDSPYTHEWKITPIEQNIKDFVESNLQISSHANYAVATAIGLHPAIANISESGKANGGSEQVYALQGYLLSGINIPEMVTTKAINYALKVNFPNKGLKLGYYHKTAEKQSDINPQNRIKEIQP